METTIAENCKIPDNKEFNNVNEMVDGCNQAIVTWALNGKGKLCKIVVMYSTNDFSLETATVGASSIIKESRDISLFKHFIYSVRNSLVKRLVHIDYWAVLLKTIPGFTPGTNVHDCRTKKERYAN